MKKSKKIYLLAMLFGSFLTTSCNDLIDSGEKPADDFVQQEVIIGDELIYGENFSYQNVYEAILGELEDTATNCRYLRSADAEPFEFEDTDLVEMVYFSAHPTSSDAIKLINEKMGYLNPAELDKDILQACDAEKSSLQKQTYQKKTI